MRKYGLNAWGSKSLSRLIWGGTTTPPNVVVGHWSEFGCKTVRFFAELFCEKSEICQFFDWQIVSNFLNEPKGESQKNTRVKSERNSNEPKGEIRLSLRWNRSERMRRLARILTRNGVADEPRGEPTLYLGEV